MNAHEKVLIVDDEPGMRAYLGRLLERAGYEWRAAASAKSALSLLAKEQFALGLVDIMMPGMDGRALLSHMRRRYAQVSVIMVTGIVDVEIAVSALRDGACDYICKPFQAEEILLRVERALERRRIVLSSWLQGEALRGAVQDQMRKLQRVSLGAVESLVFAVEAKDVFTRGHSQRVADLALAAAVQLGVLEEDAAQVHVAGLLHDVGKIAVREAVLNKPGALDPEERTHVQTHSAEGARILQPLLPDSPIVAFVKHHHERWNGKGYPDGLMDLKIPLGARLLAVADAYDAMTSLRPYRNPQSRAQARRELRACSGSQFDPEAVSAFLQALRRKVRVATEVVLPPPWPWLSGRVPEPGAGP
jgi:putative nucleotidyltransferase with HDIG domain